jgi:heat shock protein HtpX
MTEPIAAVTQSPGPAPSRPTVGQKVALNDVVRQIQTWVWRQRLMILLLGSTALYLLLVCGTLSRGGGVLFALALTAIVGVVGLRLSADRMLSLYRAEAIAPGQGTALRAAITALSRKAGLVHEPALAIVPSLAIGAFSVGTPPRMALLMTEGLLRRHALNEIVALAAHEIAHMRRGDLPVFALADTITRLAQVLFYLGVGLLGFEVTSRILGDPALSLFPIFLLVGAPMLSSRLQLNLTRQCEFEADLMAADLLGDVALMAAVVGKQTLDCGSFVDDFRLPVPQRRAPLPSPLRSHPTGAERAEKLRTSSREPAGPPLAIRDEPLISLVGFGPIEMRPRNRWPGVWF